MHIRNNCIDEIAYMLLSGEIEHKKEEVTYEVKQLLNKIEDINMPGEQGRTLLIHCCAYGYYDLAEFVVKKGARINTQDKDGYSSLHIAVKKGSPALVEFLLKNGALPNIKNKYGNTPAFDACDNWEILKLLLDHGCDINYKNLGNVSVYDLISLRSDILAQFLNYTKHNTH